MTLKSNLVGEIYGLSIIISVDSIYAMQGILTQGYGVKMVVHDNDKFPLTTTQVSTNRYLIFIVNVFKWCKAKVDQNDLDYHISEL